MTGGGRRIRLWGWRGKRSSALAIVGGEHDRALAGNGGATRLVRRVDVDDAAVFDDGDAVAEALGFFHQMRGEEDGFAAVADAADEVPDGAAGLRVEAGGELVEEDDFRIVDEREGDEEALLLAAGEIHEPGVALVGEAELIEQACRRRRLAFDRERPRGRRLPRP